MRTYRTLANTQVRCLPPDLHVDSASAAAAVEEGLR